MSKKIKKKAYKNVCCVFTLYALLLYLVHSSEEDIEKTYFVFSWTFPKGFDKRIKNSTVYHKPSNLRHRWIDWLIYRISFWRQLPHLYSATKLYMQDHQDWARFYAFNKKYTFIEDCPKYCSRSIQEESKYGRCCFQKKSFLKKIFYKCFYGSIYDSPFALHSNASDLLLTVDDPCDYLTNRKKTLLPPLTQDTWMNFSDRKKQLIIEIFDIKEHDINVFLKIENLLLTQPLWPATVSKEEHKRIFSEIIDNYEHKKLMIKPHPADVFEYEKYFPDVFVHRKPVPMELLNMLGVKLNTAITVSSNAVNTVDCTIHWYGEKYKNVLGAYYHPYTQNNNNIVFY